jgi:alpha-beta hydrolase superfamily lysophospholipase
VEAAIEERRFVFEGAGGVAITAYRWSTAVPTRAVIQVAHGLGEHALRYPGPLYEVICAGYVVYANDHRGHGASADANRYGSFGQLGFPGLVEDMNRLSRIARDEMQGYPLIMLGHSMGSFAAQLYAIDHGTMIDALALSGTSALDLLMRVRGDAPPFEFNNAPFQPARTPFDWLSRDNAQVDAYIADPRCGFALDVESAASLAASSIRMADPAELARIPKGLPIYLFAGEDDPLNLKLSLLQELIARYTAAGITSLDFDFYEGARHELLNETNRRMVVFNFMSWLNRTVK